MSRGKSRSTTTAASPTQRRVRRNPNQPEAQAGSPSDSTEKLMHLRLPLLLLAGGIGVQFLIAWWGQRTLPGALHALRQVGAEILAGTAVMLAAIFIVAKLRGIKLGSFWLAVLKLAAVSIAPSAITSLTGAFFRFVPFVGWLINALIGFCLYFALLGMFFDLDQDDTWYCVLIIFLVGLAGSLLLRPLL
jgi:hypothetical protein